MTPARRELLRLGVLLFVGLVAGFFSGAYRACLFAAVAVWIALQVAEFRRFWRWSERPLARPDNASELWQVPTARLYRSLRASRQRATDLLAQLRRLRGATEALPDGAVLMSTRGVIEAFNSSARQLLGLSIDDRGQNLNYLLRHPDLTALINGEIEDNLIEIAAPADDERRLEVRKVAVDDDQVLILARDVTQLNRLLTMRQDFVANVSHELRTPLTVIMGYLEALQDDSLDRRTLREVLAKLVSPAQRMRSLVDDLLLLTRLESSAPANQKQLDEVDVATLLRRIVADAHQLSGGRHEIVTEIESGLRIRGVETELHSAFGNLISNAVRYSPGGGTVTIRWYRTEAGARFEVEDQGVGIAPEHLSRITERFYRIDLAGARVRGGTGLGLAIVKHVLKRHATELEVRSELGKGSLFFCEFPMQEAASAAATRS